ncbi:polysaccharide biosynthesis protein [Komagataeibacter rhaeticus]|uniref:Lipopolysaccharide biosynthesis protein n=1 Tax=Komagataeibacter rhaeticus TaxID=215221 RepID=A0A181CBZ9_9PROT|nr:lipopolysaccharide biosynthesis protein [Komagataeibacter rhaeticus]ATU72099.1 polysaccharide biosynthesis protein [Komagataeibacter xylinus]EGG75344.1 Inner membrane protein yghQ [Gluconacetobacter sp. SXCC-1]KDU95592.1 polysaccharide biosynthesis protein [Komagataeibacter rhaeticus AF1]MBL7238888.1 lipopolysaccharide biosynthesis protein [Komagataeibacter rhaeticus]PYD54484.1 polysaccharide biosynthesis protein [Komagataeibacter rhaeticus]
MSTDERDALKRIFGNTGFLIAGRATNAICSFVYVAWAVRALGLRQFGVLMLVTTFAAAVSAATHLLSWQPLLHYGTDPFTNGRRAEFSRVLAFCIRADYLSGGVGWLVGTVGVALFGTYMGWPVGDQGAAMLYMLTIAFMNTSWSAGVFRLCNSFWLTMLTDLSGALVRTVGSGIGFFCHFGLDYYLLVWSLTQLVMFISSTALGWMQVRRSGGTSGFSLFSRLRAGDAPGIWRFTLSTSCNHLLGSVFNQFGTLLVGGVLGPADAAVYRVSRQIGEGIAKPAQLMMPALYPELIRLREKQDWYGIKRVVRKLFLMIGGFSILLMGVAMVLGNTLLTWMLHVHWHGGRSLIMLMLGSAILGLGVVPLEPLLTVIGQVSQVLKGRIIVTLTYLPLVYGMTMAWHLEGAAAAADVAALIMLCICLRPVIAWFRRVAPGRRPPHDDAAPVVVPGSTREGTGL